MMSGWLDRERGGGRKMMVDRTAEDWLCILCLGLWRGLFCLFPLFLLFSSLIIKYLLISYWFCSWVLIFQIYFCTRTLLLWSYTTLLTYHVFCKFTFQTYLASASGKSVVIFIVFQINRTLILCVLTFLYDFLWVILCSILIYWYNMHFHVLISHVAFFTWYIKMTSYLY